MTWFTLSLGFENETKQNGKKLETKQNRTKLRFLKTKRKKKKRDVTGNETITTYRFQPLLLVLMCSRFRTFLKSTLNVKEEFFYSQISPIQEII